MNILIVDDEREITDMVKAILTIYSMKTYVVNSGANVYEAIDTISPDLILMDIYLGDSDGRALCQNLKIVDRYKDIPVLLYSAGFITETSIVQSLANDFLRKPFDIEILISKIQRLLINPHTRYITNR